MTDIELKKILARIAVADKRTVDAVTAAHWRECIGDLPYGDVMTAVTRHFRDSTEYLMPAHIRALVAQIQRERRTGEIAAAPCNHRFDETSGYCVHCAIRDDAA